MGSQCIVDQRIYQVHEMLELEGREKKQMSLHKITETMYVKWQHRRSLRIVAGFGCASSMLSANCSEGSI